MLSRLLDLWTIGLFRDALIVGIALGTVCSLLSVVVVLKRMAFIGEGIAHAGFGGMGTALVVGATGGVGGLGTWQSDLIVLAFCMATAIAIGRSRAGDMSKPTAPSASCSSPRWPGACC